MFFCSKNWIDPMKHKSVVRETGTKQHRIVGYGLQIKFDNYLARTTIIINNSCSTTIIIVIVIIILADGHKYDLNMPFPFSFLL